VAVVIVLPVIVKSPPTVKLLPTLTFPVKEGAATGAFALS